MGNFVNYINKKDQQDLDHLLITCVRFGVSATIEICSTIAIPASTLISLLWATAISAIIFCALNLRELPSAVLHCLCELRNVTYAALFFKSRQCASDIGRFCQ